MKYSLYDCEAILEGLEERREEAKEKGDWVEVEKVDKQIKEVENELDNIKTLLDAE